VTDAAGSVVRELGARDFADGLSAGVHRIQWDLRHDPIADSLVFAGGGGGGGGVGGSAPFVLPGTYRVTLNVDGRDGGTKSVTVNGDPLSVITDVDRKAWHDLSLAVHQLQGNAGLLRARIAEASMALGSVRTLVTRAGNAPSALRTSVDAVDRDLRTLRQQFGVTMPGEAAPSGRGGGGGGGGVQPVPAVLGQVKSQLLASTSRPTEIQVRMAREARADLVAAVESLNRVIATGIPGVYQALGQPQLAPSLRPSPPSRSRFRNS
jgi:hypothetical protein